MSSASASHAASVGTLPQRHGRPSRDHSAWLLEHRAQLLACIAVVAIVAGGVLHLVGKGQTGQLVWGAAVALLAADLAVEVARSIIIERSLGVDTIALVAMVGSLAMSQELAGLVVGLMFSSGAALETVASRRARRELTALVQRAPKVAQLRVGDGLQEAPLSRCRSAMSWLSAAVK